SSRIIEPIQSRCAIFRFRPLPRDQAILFLNRIAIGEKLDVEGGAYDALLRVSEGDMRRAVNIFQASATAGKITEATVYDMIAGAHPRLIREIITSALRGDFIDSRKNLVNMLRDGIAGEDIVKEIGRQVYELDIPETQKVRLIEKIGEFEYRMSRGGNAQIQLEALLAQFAILK
ncbi:MAG: Replication factor C small subunit, partial [Candidatus Aenigmatarchaeota archaeon]